MLGSRPHRLLVYCGGPSLLLEPALGDDVVIGLTLISFFIHSSKTSRGVVDQFLAGRGPHLDVGRVDVLGSAKCDVAVADATRCSRR